MRNIILSRKRKAGEHTSYNSLSFSRLLLLVLVFSSLLPALTPSAAGQAIFGNKNDAWAEETARIDIEGVRNRRSRIEGGDYDDKRDVVSMRVKLKNRSMNDSYEKMEGKLVLFGKHVKETTKYRVLDVQGFKFDLPAGMREGQFEWESQKVVTEWDRTDIYFGERFDGWTVILLNADGKIVAAESSKPAWEKPELVANAVNLRKDAWVNRDLEPVAPAKDNTGVIVR